MGYADQHNELRSRFNVAWGITTPIAWPNLNFTPPNPQASWVRFQIVDGESNQIGLGAMPATTRYAGIIWVQIFTKQDIGDGAAYALADTVKSIFHNWCGNTVRCFQAKIKTVGNEGNGWFQVNVSIPFIRDESI
jgi:hypothetical protein